jgi:GH35 family endo-1,4-beta-xylanase
MSEAPVLSQRGLRTGVPWYATSGPPYVAEAFHIAHQQDPATLQVLNEFGFETVNRCGDQPGPLITEMDVLDDGLPADAAVRDLEDLRPKPAYRALSNALTSAPRHHPSWPITRHVAGASA